MQLLDSLVHCVIVLISYIAVIQLVLESLVHYAIVFIVIVYI